MDQYDVIVVGGGAAGLFFAGVAGKRGKRVLVVESANKVGKKILMSGGGRCNFTNTNCGPEHFISANPHFCKSALSRYTPWDFIELVSRHEIPWHEKTLGQLFCDQSSKDILNALLAECRAGDVTILTDTSIAEVSHTEGFRVQGRQLDAVAPRLVVATGGLSIPKMGASDFGYRLARQFGHNVLQTRAGLVPFTFSGQLLEHFQALSGLSLPVVIETPSASFAEAMLFTHRGLSGPAVLQASSYWHEGEVIAIDLLPDRETADWLQETKTAQPRTRLRSLLAGALPRNLAGTLETLLFAEQADTAIAEIPDRQLRSLGEQLNRWQLKPAGTEGYRTAEVTLGGVDTDQVSSRTMESNQVPGLYFIGEVLDVTGHLGGFNFQWAWASAHAAATSF